MPSGKDGHHPGWKPLQGSASDHVPGWAPSPRRLPGPVPRYVQVSVGFSPPRPSQAPPPERQKRCAGQGVRGSSGVRASGRQFLKSYYECLSWGKACACARACVYGRVLGAGALQTQSRFLLKSRAGGYGAGVHGRSRLRGSGCLRVLAVRRRGRPAGPARRGAWCPHSFCVLSLARPCHRRCSTREYLVNIV